MTIKAQSIEEALQMAAERYGKRPEPIVAPQAASLEELIVSAVNDNLEMPELDPAVYLVIA
jgi:hypothetical protein